jgi:hypothetical protein
LAGLVGSLVQGCQFEEYPAPIPHSTYRIEKDIPAEGSELTVDLFTTWVECANAKIDDLESCMPRVDRAAGEVRIGFDLRDPTTSQPVFRSVERDQIVVSHDNARQPDFDLIPHDPVAGGQLFVLLIDGSGSMYENGGERVQKVYQALMTPSVIDGFYPPGNNKSGVVLARFNNEVKGLDGGPLKVITSAADYRAMVKGHLTKQSGGYTHMYSAVQYGTTELLALDEISTFMAVKSVDQPTIVLLTDGFNNQEARDTCADNVPRLQGVIDTLKEVRTGQGAKYRPTVHTVGLGRPYRKGTKPEGLNQKVTTPALCGKYADQPINGHLENYGIDHVSLEWIAEIGGGNSFVKREPRGLAEVFKKAAAKRYRWYELHYRVPDNFWHRKSFEVQVRLMAYARAYTSVTVHPSAWLDAPTGFKNPGDKWTTPSPLRRTAVLLMPILGMLVFLSFLGPATFNVRRAIFRRARPRDRK